MQEQSERSCETENCPNKVTGKKQFCEDCKNRKQAIYQKKRRAKLKDRAFASTQVFAVINDQQPQANKLCILNEKVLGALESILHTDKSGIKRTEFGTEVFIRCEHETSDRRGSDEAFASLTDIADITKSLIKDTIIPQASSLVQEGIGNRKDTLVYHDFSLCYFERSEHRPLPFMHSGSLFYKFLLPLGSSKQCSPFKIYKGPDISEEAASRFVGNHSNPRLKIFRNLFQNKLDLYARMQHMTQEPNTLFCLKCDTIHTDCNTSDEPQVVLCFLGTPINQVPRRGPSTRYFTWNVISEIFIPEAKDDEKANLNNVHTRVMIDWIEDKRRQAFSEEDIELFRENCGKIMRL